LFHRLKSKFDHNSLLASEKLSTFISVDLFKLLAFEHKDYSTPTLRDAVFNTIRTVISFARMNTNVLTKRQKNYVERELWLDSDDLEDIFSQDILRDILHSIAIACLELSEETDVGSKKRYLVSINNLLYNLNVIKKEVQKNDEDYSQVQMLIKLAADQCNNHRSKLNNRLRKFIDSLLKNFVEPDERYNLKSNQNKFSQFLLKYQR
jgi:hypothetical protein